MMKDLILREFTLSDVLSLIQADVDQFKPWGFNGSVLCGVVLLQGVNVEV